MRSDGDSDNERGANVANGQVECAVLLLLLRVRNISNEGICRHTCRDRTQSSDDGLSGLSLFLRLRKDSKVDGRNIQTAERMPTTSFFIDSPPKL